MIVTVKALTEFQHGYLRGRLDAVTGGEYQIPTGVADDLVKAGLVEILPAETAPAETAPAETGPDDLVGGDKAEAEPENKMAPAPANKGKK